jgi:predicted extracellular nuclease
MKQFFLLMGLMIGGALSLNAQCTELFISEYVEGSSSNKYIEIYNPTGATVDLSNYELRLYSGGNTSPNNTNTLSGTLAAGEVIVYRNSGANIYSGPTTAISSVNYNGDDAIELYNTATMMSADIFGSIGEDPGSQWGTTATNETQNQTLRRNSDVTGGVTMNPAPGFPTLQTEWTELDEDDVSGLGSHTFDGCTPAFNPGDIIITEIMHNPSQVPDNVGEWFEVYNTTGSTIDLNGWTISDAASNMHTINNTVNVAAGNYVVLGINADVSTNGGVMIQHEYSSNILLNNSSSGLDAITLTDPAGNIIDVVDYSQAGFPDPSGASISLDPSAFDATSNDNGANWCEATSCLW